jgi:Zn finger protein HypA/HybF involved in hydrogenase expression
MIKRCRKCRKEFEPPKRHRSWYCPKCQHKKALEITNPFETALEKADEYNYEYLKSLIDST